MAEIPKSGFLMDSELHRQQSSSDFVAVDIAKLPIINKSLSRKGDAAASLTTNGGDHAYEKPASGHVVASNEPVLLPRASTPTAAAGAGKYRRLGSGRRLSSPWLHPRRVMFAFATLSSMGTLILLYFTFSMAKTSGGGDADAR